MELYLHKYKLEALSSVLAEQSSSVEQRIEDMCTLNWCQWRSRRKFRPALMRNWLSGRHHGNTPPSAAAKW